MQPSEARNGRGGGAVEALGGAEFAPAATRTTYLNTGAAGLLPARAAAALRQSVTESASHGTMGRDYFAPADAARASFARLVGVATDRVAVTASVAVSAALLATIPEPGAEVLVPEGDFSSLVTPFTARADVVVRAVPLDRLASEVGPATALVACAAVQARDGRVTDLSAVTAAARAHGALVCVDGTQAVGWLPVSAAEVDVLLCGAYKWLMCPRGATFAAFGPAFGTERPWPVARHAGWVAAADPGESNYGEVHDLAAGARRYDEPWAHLAQVGAAASLSLVEEIGVAAVHAHDLALADRYRAGLAGLGLVPLPAPGSAIVSVPGLAGEVPRLAEAGVTVSGRAGGLRASFHLYNSSADVDRLLELLDRS